MKPDEIASTRKNSPHTGLWFVSAPEKRALGATSTSSAAQDPQ
jgi:hypothetical protein